jgi:hypothetical protein
MKPQRLSLLPVFYGLCATLGLVIPWYFNLKYVLIEGQTFTVQAFLKAGFTNTLASSLSSDFFIGLTAVLVWMMVEAKRIGLRHRWIYFVLTFVIAFAFSCPLFLLVRHIHLQRAQAKVSNS